MLGTCGPAKSSLARPVKGFIAWTGCMEAREVHQLAYTPKQACEVLECLVAYRAPGAYGLRSSVKAHTLCTGEYCGYCARFTRECSVAAATSHNTHPRASMNQLMPSPVAID